MTIHWKDGSALVSDGQVVFRDGMYTIQKSEWLHDETTGRSSGYLRVLGVINMDEVLWIDYEDSNG